MSLHEDLKAYIDGELDPVRAEEVRVALDRDPSLKREFSQLQALSAELRESSPEIAVRGLDRTLAALERTKTSRRPVATSWIYGLGLSAAAIAVAFLILPNLLVKHDDADTASAVAMDRNASTKSNAAGEAPMASAAAAIPPMEAVKHQTMAAKSAAPAPSKLELQNGEQPKAGRDRRFVFNDNQTESKNITPPTTLNSSSGGTFGLHSTRKSLNAPTVVWAGGRAANGEAALNSVHVDSVPTTVTVVFPTTSEGFQKVLAVAGQYQVADKQLPAREMALKKQVAVTDQIVLDIPDEIAGKVIEEIKRTSPSVQPVGQARQVFSSAAGASAVLPGKSANDADAAKAVTKSTGAVSLSTGTSARTMAKAGASNATPPGQGRSARRGGADSSGQVDGGVKVNTLQNKANFAPIEGGRAKMPAVRDVATNSIHTFTSNRPKTRRVIVIIREKQKRDPVP